jgi:hypothetical protein
MRCGEGKGRERKDGKVRIVPWAGDVQQKLFHVFLSLNFLAFLEIEIGIERGRLGRLECEFAPERWRGMYVPTYYVYTSQSYELS